MSLVAYDSSDESEEEEFSEKKKTPESHRKRKEGVKIRIPSLKEFEDDEAAPVVKKPKLQSGSGLTSLLPPPKNSTTLSKPGFVPHILSSKKEQSSLTSKEIKNDIDTKLIASPSVTSEDQGSDEEIPSAKDKSSGGDASVSASNDFFWLDDLASNEKAKQENENKFSTPAMSNNFFQNFSSRFPSTSNIGIQQLYKNEPKAVPYFQQFQQLSETGAFQIEKISEQRPSSVEQSYSLGNYSVSDSVNELDTRESLLKDKEFLKLQGRKCEFENIDIIDVNADDQLTDKNEWLMKSLTEESTHRPSRKKHNMPTQQQKRKHQITYLAFQAKERENDLKNQWALNSRTRRETQAKYGF